MSSQRSTKCISWRTILFLMVLITTIMEGLLVSNMQITLVEMVKSNNNNNISEDTTIKFDWDPSQSGKIIGAAFLGSALSRIPGGRLAEVCGSKIVVGVSVLISALLTLSTPLIIYMGNSNSFHYYFILLNRFAIGFFAGNILPGVVPLCSRWFPKRNNSKFSSNLLGPSIGFVISYSLNGLILSNYSWIHVFYINGAIAVVSAMLWCFTVFDLPEDHPHISETELRNVVMDTSENDITKSKTRFGDLPFWEILTSQAFWAIAITNICFSSVTLIPTSIAPIFLTKYLQIDIGSTGFILAYAGIGHYITGLIVSRYIEGFVRRCLNNDITCLRKIFSSISMFGSAVMTIIVIFLGDSIVIYLLYTVLSKAFLGCAVAGHIPNCLDIAPNYAGTIFGISNTIGGIISFVLLQLAVIIVGDGCEFGDWQNVFCLLLGLYFVGGLAFLAFGSGKLQPWNRCENSDGGNK